MTLVTKRHFKIKNIIKSTTLGVALIFASSAFAAHIPEKKQTVAGLYATAIEASKLLEGDDVVLIDVRSRAEIAFLGMPTDADVNLPYMVMPMFPEYDEDKSSYVLEINPDFPIAFETWAAANGYSKDSSFILMCRSGSRSAKAADLIYEMGYQNVYSIIDGYEGDKAKEGEYSGQRVVNGWRNAGLAWSYKISPSQVYPMDAN